MCIFFFFPFCSGQRDERADKLFFDTPNLYVSISRGVIKKRKKGIKSNLLHHFSLHHNKRLKKAKCVINLVNTKCFNTSLLFFHKLGNC